MPRVQFNYRLCTVFGIPVYLNITTIFMMLLMLQCGSLSLAIVLAGILLFSIVAHELGHALTARCFGCRTSHIMLTVIGGCASMERLPSKGWQELLTAAAGPAVSVVMAIALHFLDCVIGGGNMLGIGIYYGSIMNMTLALFNLLPGFPMDGGRIFRSTLLAFFNRAKATYIAMVVGRVAAVALVVLPMLGVNHLWIIPIGGNWFLRAMIAWMIWQEGYKEYLAALNDEAWERDSMRVRVSPPPYDR